MFPDAPEPFIDLSTGINPHPYPVPELSSALFERLPDRADVRRLAAVAAQCLWRAVGGPRPARTGHANPAAEGRDAGCPPAAPPSFAPPMRSIGAPHRLPDTASPKFRAPINSGAPTSPSSSTRTIPTAVVVERATLLDIADELRPRSGLLVVDESFADVAPPGASLAGDIGRGNIVVLRSFGKFYGLAGLRLGFALAAPTLVDRLDAMLGPWAVAGPALFIGEKALADRAWKEQTLARLAEAVARLDDYACKRRA